MGIRDDSGAYCSMKHRFAVAPMLDWTDRHERFFLRLISRHALLYTEMVTTGAIIHGHRERFLDFHRDEHPLALQLGGSDPGDLKTCCRIAEDYGYDEINLNVGCPSERVQNGSFGACLMAEPQLVAECVAAMKTEVAVPVTVKHRIGIDDRDSYEALFEFVTRVAEAGCETFIVHARKAWLKGLSPKQNREVPPLRYDLVYQIKKDFPQLNIVINGGVQSLEQALQQLQQVDGVMMGREVYQNPYVLARVDELFYGDHHALPTPREVLRSFLPYVSEELAKGTRLHAMTRHILGLFQGMPGAKAWRRHISENATRPNADLQVLLDAADKVREQ